MGEVSALAVPHLHKVSYRYEHGVEVWSSSMLRRQIAEQVPHSRASLADLKQVFFSYHRNSVVDSDTGLVFPRDEPGISDPDFTFPVVEIGMRHPGPYLHCPLQSGLL